MKKTALSFVALLFLAHTQAGAEELKVSEVLQLANVQSAEIASIPKGGGHPIFHAYAQVEYANPCLAENSEIVVVEKKSTKFVRNLLIANKQGASQCTREYNPVLRTVEIASFTNPSDGLPKITLNGKKAEHRDPTIHNDHVLIEASSIARELEVVSASKIVHLHRSPNGSHQTLTVKAKAIFPNPCLVPEDDAVNIISVTQSGNQEISLFEMANDQICTAEYNPVTVEITIFEDLSIVSVPGSIKVNGVNAL